MVTAASKSPTEINLKEKTAGYNHLICWRTFYCDIGTRHVGYSELKNWRLCMMPIFSYRTFTRDQQQCTQIYTQHRSMSHFFLRFHGIKGRQTLTHALVSGWLQFHPTSHATKFSLVQPCILQVDLKEQCPYTDKAVKNKTIVTPWTPCPLSLTNDTSWNILVINRKSLYWKQ